MAAEQHKFGSLRSKLSFLPSNSATSKAPQHQQPTSSPFLVPQSTSRAKSSRPSVDKALPPQPYYVPQFYTGAAQVDEDPYGGIAVNDGPSVYRGDHTRSVSGGTVRAPTSPMSSSFPPVQPFPSPPARISSRPAAKATSKSTPLKTLNTAGNLDTSHHPSSIDIVNEGHSNSHSSAVSGQGRYSRQTTTNSSPEVSDKAPIIPLVPDRPFTPPPRDASLPSSPHRNAISFTSPPQQGFSAGLSFGFPPPTLQSGPRGDGFDRTRSVSAPANDRSGWIEGGRANEVSAKPKGRIDSKKPERPGGETDSLGSCGSTSDTALPPSIIPSPPPQLPPLVISPQENWAVLSSSDVALTEASPVDSTVLSPGPDQPPTAMQTPESVFEIDESWLRSLNLLERRRSSENAGVLLSTNGLGVVVPGREPMETPAAIVTQSDQESCTKQLLPSLPSNHSPNDKPTQNYSPPQSQVPKPSYPPKSQSAVLTEEDEDDVSSPSFSSAPRRVSQSNPPKISNSRNSSPVRPTASSRPVNIFQSAPPIQNAHSSPGPSAPLSNHVNATSTANSSRWDALLSHAAGQEKTRDGMFGPTLFAKPGNSSKGKEKEKGSSSPMQRASSLLPSLATTSASRSSVSVPSSSPSSSTPLDRALPDPPPPAPPPKPLISAIIPPESPSTVRLENAAPSQSHTVDVSHNRPPQQSLASTSTSNQFPSSANWDALLSTLRPSAQPGIHGPPAFSAGRSGGISKPHSSSSGALDKILDGASDLLPWKNSKEGSSSSISPHAGPSGRSGNAIASSSGTQQQPHSPADWSSLLQLAANSESPAGLHGPPSFSSKPQAPFSSHVKSSSASTSRDNSPYFLRPSTPPPSSSTPATVPIMLGKGSVASPASAPANIALPIASTPGQWNNLLNLSASHPSSSTLHGPPVFSSKSLHQINGGSSSSPANISPPTPPVVLPPQPLVPPRVRPPVTGNNLALSNPNLLSKREDRAVLGKNSGIGITGVVRNGVQGDEGDTFRGSSFNRNMLVSPCLCCAATLSYPSKVTSFRCSVCGTITDVELSSRRASGRSKPSDPTPLSLERFLQLIHEARNTSGGVSDEEGSGDAEYPDSGDNSDVDSIEDAKTIEGDSEDEDVLAYRGKGPMLSNRVSVHSRRRAKTPDQWWASVELELESVFSHWGSLSSSFSNGNPVTLQDAGVDLDAVKTFYMMLDELPVELSLSVIRGLEVLLRRPRRRFEAGTNGEGLAWILIVFANPKLSSNPSSENRGVSSVFKRFLGIISNLPNDHHHYLVHWFSNLYSEEVFLQRVDLINSSLSMRIQKHIADLAQVRNRDKILPYVNDWRFRSAARTLSLFFAANSMKHQLSVSVFYVTLVDHLDLVADYEHWVKSAGSSSKAAFFISQYPFLISLGAKLRILVHDSKRQMEAQGAQPIVDISGRRLVHNYIKIKVRRSRLLEDSLQQISSHMKDLKRNLRIEFEGEEGVDAGGLKKEWFLLLVRELLDPQYGMFLWDEETHLCWFNPASLEAADQYALVGVVVGLAVYHSSTLDIRLPRALFKKLLNKPVGIEDLKVFQPTLVKGLEDLLAFEGNVEETFCRTFVGEYESYGEIITVPLIPKGADTAVTNDNRQDFVNKYVQFLLVDSISRQFKAFQRGWLSVCEGNALSLFHAEEIELLVRGSPEELDVGQLRAVTTYDGCDNNEPLIESFWSIVSFFSLERQQQLLAFTTGSSTIPATGLVNLTFRIQVTRDSPDHLPSSHTCFNTICLPRYKSRTTLEKKLVEALTMSSGFGLK